MLNRFPLDATRLSPQTGGPVSAAAAYSSDRSAPRIQETNADGVPMWRVKILVETDSGLDTISVKFPSRSEPQGFTATHKPVTITGLVAGMGTSGPYFFAESVTVNASDEKKGATA